MFLPQRAAIEILVELCAIIHIVKAPDPDELGRIPAIEQLTEDECSHLLKSLRKIAFKIAGKLRARSFFDYVSAELNHLKIFQMVCTPFPVFSRVLISPSRCHGDHRGY